MPNRKFLRSGGSHNVIIRGKPINIYFARIKYRCIHCLSELDTKNAGLICKANDNHYGFIHESEAANLTTEERFMKIGDMFPSDYLRGVDIAEPLKVKIIKVTSEQVRNRDNNKMEAEFVVYFEGESRKLRLNWTMAKEIHFDILGLQPDDDVIQRWPGNYVTIYRTKVKAFGKEHIVPRVRKPERGDKIYPPVGKEKALNVLDRAGFWARVKRDLALPVEVSKFVLTQAGMDGEYKPENAPKMWTELESTGVRLNGFLDAVLEDVPYYRTKGEILALMTEWNTGYRFEEDFEMSTMAALETHAKTKADEEQSELEQISFAEAA